MCLVPSPEGLGSGAETLFCRWQGCPARRASWSSWRLEPRRGRSGWRAGGRRHGDPQAREPRKGTRPMSGLQDWREGHTRRGEGTGWSSAESRGTRTGATLGLPARVTGRLALLSAALPVTRQKSRSVPSGFRSPAGYFRYLRLRHRPIFSNKIPSHGKSGL